MMPASASGRLALDRPHDRAITIAAKLRNLADDRAGKMMAGKGRSRQQGKRQAGDGGEPSGHIEQSLIVAGDLTTLRACRRGVEFVFDPVEAIA